MSTIFEIKVNNKSDFPPSPGDYKRFCIDKILKWKEYRKIQFRIYISEFHSDVQMIGPEVYCCFIDYCVYGLYCPLV